MVSHGTSQASGLIDKASNLHQEDPSFAFLCFFMLFLLFYEKSRKSTKKPSATLARVLSEAVKKVYCLQKYFRSKKYSQKITSSDKMEVVSVILHEKI